MLKGKVALVTGGTSDVGRNICQVFAREGASVVIADKEENEPHIIAQALKPGDNSQWFSHIAINKDDMKTLRSVKDCIIHGIFINKDRKPTLNVCINCAGVISQSSILSSDETVYEQFLDLQLKSTVSITRTVCDLWASKEMSGSVVNVSCIPYILKGSKNWSTYVANIEAIKGFSKSVNKEYGRHKIRCNTVCDKQYGRSEGTAEIVAYLASDYSSYVTASHVSIDGKIMYGNH